MQNTNNSFQKLCLLILSIVLALNTSAQSPKFIVYGKFIVEKGNYDNSRISITENGQKWKNIEGDKKFEFALDYNKLYIFAFEKKGYVTKRIKIDTHVPQGALKKPFPDFPFHVSIFQQYEGVNTIIYNQPVGLIKYNPDYDDFGYDTDYTKSIRSQMAKVDEDNKKAEEEQKKKEEEAAKEAERQAQLAAQQEALDEKYNNLTANADELANKEEYDKAKQEYMKASKLKPTEQYPKSQIQKMGNLAAKKKAEEKRNQEYTTAIENAEKHLKNKNYQQSLNEFEKAKNLKPEESYPKQKIAEVNSIVQTNKDFLDAIGNGDNFLKQGKAEMAIDEYKKAKKLKPSEGSVDKKIAKANEVIAERVAKQKAQEEYDNAIKAADDFYAAEQYEKAIAQYNAASEIKPGEQYPKSQTDKINSKIAANMKAEEKDAEYNKAITNADNLLAEKEYAKAKSGYSKAMSIKPNENYPKNKIAEIDKIIAELDQQEQQNSEYMAAIDNGDKFFENKNYLKAKTEYKKALSVKPNESYPQDKINEIEKRLAELGEQEQKEAEYKNAVELADNFFNVNKYNKAKSSYQSALQIKPEENYPKEKISEINKILEKNEAEQKALTEAVRKKEMEEAKKKQEQQEQNLLAQQELQRKKQEAANAALEEKKKAETQASIEAKKRLERQKALIEERKRKAAAMYAQNDNYSEKNPERNIKERYYTEGNKEVTEVIVTQGKKKNIYRKVKHSWGGIYYFRDKLSISASVFEMETK